jgi:hypothetical protein
MIHCDAPGCIRGLVREGEWGRPCNVCGGRGGFSVYAVSKRLEEDDGTLRRILDPSKRMRPKTAARICAKIVDLVTRKHQKQRDMFAP